VMEGILDASISDLGNFLTAQEGKMPNTDWQSLHIIYDQLVKAKGKLMRIASLLQTERL